MLRKLDLTVEIGGDNYRVTVRERCNDSFEHFLILHYILRSRNPRFEYWVELHQGFERVATSNRFGGDSYSTDTAQLHEADQDGATVIFDHGFEYQFRWDDPVP